MPEPDYVLSNLAKEDIKAIARYTIEKFGPGQSLKYARGLKIILAALAENPEMGRRYVAVKNQMILRYRYRAHVIFYYITASGIFIVRVLGGRMDHPKHLK